MIVVLMSVLDSNFRKIWTVPKSILYFPVLMRLEERNLSIVGNVYGMDEDGRVKNEDKPARWILETTLGLGGARTAVPAVDADTSRPVADVEATATVAV